MNPLYEPVNLGSHTLSNRLVMAPMTRSRAQVDGTPGEDAALYYAQRASIGLIISEGTQPSDDGQGYLATPGLYTDAHIQGWKKVIRAVHDNGGKIFIQLMHAGRMSHPDNTPHHRQGLAPSAIAPGTNIFTPTGMQDIPVPSALTREEIQQTVQDFRFALEVATAIADEIGADKTGIRFSPGATLWGIDEGDEGPELYRYLTRELNKLALAYLHIMNPIDTALLQDMRSIWQQTLILNRPGRAIEEIGTDIDQGVADLESYGQMVLANPDFVERLQANAPLNQADSQTYFGGTSIGYTDYPSMADAIPT